MSSISGSAIRTKKSPRKIGRSAKWRQARRNTVMERLEDRTLLSYTFSFNPLTRVATATGTAAVDSLVIEPQGSFLLYSVNGSPFAGNWGGNSVPLESGLVINVALSTGDGSSLNVGTPAGPISNLGGIINVIAQPNTTDTVTLDDSGATGPLGGNTYNINTISGQVSGTNFTYNESSSNDFEGGVTLLGSPIDGDVYNVTGVVANEPFNIVTGSSGASEVFVGNSGLLPINAPLAITTSGGTASVSIDDSSDSANGTATFDTASGNSNAPYEITGLSTAPIEFGSGVTGVSLSGGTDGGSGVDFDFNETPSAITTTVNGGGNKNFFNLSNSSEANGLDNLQGPVVVNGGSSGTDVVTLQDSDANFGDAYNISATTVTRVIFGGLTYDDSIGTLTLDAENLLGTNGNNIININNTADGVTTNINGQDGADIINVYDTSSSGTLNITSGTSTGNTINVVADNAPVNLVMTDTGDTDIVNIGSVGVAGSMAAILGAIGITDTTGTYALNFHDENDPTAQEWVLQCNNIGDTASVEFESGIATTTYAPTDLTGLFISGSSGAGDNFFLVENTSASSDTSIFPNGLDDSVDVEQTADTTLTIESAQDDFVALGGVADVGLGELQGIINISNPPAYTEVTLDDSENLTGRTYDISNSGVETVTGTFSAATINLADGDISSVTIDAALVGNNIATVTSYDFDYPVTFNSGAGGGNTVNLDANPDGDFIVTGTGSGNALNIDAEANMPIITAGGSANEVNVGFSGGGDVDSTGYAITISDVGTIPIVPGPFQTISGVEGQSTTDSLLGTFTFVIPQIGGVPLGVSPSSFTSTVFWGDLSASFAPDIVQDASNPSIYYINGTHTYADDGTYGITTSVAYDGGSYSSTLNGALVTVDLAAGDSTSEPDDVVNIAHALVPVNVPSITGTEGQAIAAGTIATFDDEGGNFPTTDFTAQIVITNALGVTVFNGAATSITNPSGNTYDVVAPAITLPEEGTYTVKVTVTDNSQADVYTSVGTATATISDAPLTAGSAKHLTPNTGATINTTVGTFTDGNPTGPISDFTATINWGDGTPTTVGVITQPGGVGTAFDVAGLHAYAVYGSYTLTISVADAGGSTIQLTGSATVTDLAVTGSVNNFTANEFVNTGNIVLAVFTDPNPLATSSTVSAALPAGGWGDGTPASSSGLSVTLIGATSTSTLFEVTGNHTYDSSGPFTVNITVTTSGGVATNLTAGTATVIAPNFTLAFAKQPTTAVAGQSFKPFSVDVQSLAHKTLKNNNSPVIIAISSGPTDTFYGAATVSAVNGVATFTNFSIQEAGTYRLVATQLGVTVFSKFVTVVPGPVAYISEASPPNVTAGQTDPGFTVGLTDVYGNQITAKTSVSFTIQSGPAGAKIVGSAKTTAVNGVAQFSGFSFPVAGTYTLNVVANGVVQSTESFTVAPAAPEALRVLPSPNPIFAGAPIQPGIVAQVVDKFGNLATNGGGNVTISIANGPLGGVLDGTTSLALTGGEVTFGNLNVTTPGNYVLLISYGGLQQTIAFTALAD